MTAEGKPATEYGVDVIIPTNGRKDMLLGAIASALAQEDVRVSCIVVDDASEDGTPELIESLGVENVRLIRHAERLGPSASRNDGLMATTAPWVAFLDDDDLWAPDKLRSQFDALDRTPDARWATTGCVLTDEALNLTGSWALDGGGGQVFDRLLTECVIPAGGSSVLVAKDLLAETGDFDTQLGAAEDWDLWLRLARRSPIAYVDRPLVAYRRWSQNLSNDLSYMGRYRQQLADRYAHERPLDYLRRSDVYWMQGEARSALTSGKRLKAARLYARVAFSGRHPGQLAYSAGSILLPNLVQRRLQRADRTQITEAWRQESAWLLRELAIP